MKEIDIQNEIRCGVNDLAILFRCNVGKLKTPDGRWIDIGLPKGFSDLVGVRKKDGKAVFLEVKKPGRKPSKKQKKFIAAMNRNGAIAGVVYSVEGARIILS